MEINGHYGKELMMEKVTLANLDEVREIIAANDQREAVKVGQIISHWHVTYAGGQVGCVTVWDDTQTAALCLGGPSIWGVLNDQGDMVCEDGYRYDIVTGDCIGERKI